MKYFTFHIKMYKFCQLISQKILNQKEFYYSVLPSRSATRICNKKWEFHFKKFKITLVTSPKIKLIKLLNRS